MSAQNVNWLFTINNPTSPDIPKSWSNVKYCIWQLEEGENGTSHLQGYVILKKKGTLAAVKRLDRHAHWEIRRGTHAQAKEYCSKEETRKDGPWEFGEEPRPGKRNDLEEVYNLIIEGKSNTEIANAVPVTFMRYHKGITAMKLYLTKPRSFKTEVTVIWGEIGVGKSKWAFDKFGGEAYWKPPNSKWWDGYEGQSVAIIDEFYGWLSWTEILRLCDRYPCQVETKGGSVQFVSKTLVFLSNQHPLEWYTNPKCKYPTLARRIENLGKMEEDGKIVVEKGSF